MRRLGHQRVELPGGYAVVVVRAHRHGQSRNQAELLHNEQNREGIDDDPRQAAQELRRQPRDAQRARQRHEEHAIGAREEHCAPSHRFGVKQQRAGRDQQAHQPERYVDARNQHAGAAHQQHQRREAHRGREQQVDVVGALGRLGVDAEQRQTGRGERQRPACRGVQTAAHMHMPMPYSNGESKSRSRGWFMSLGERVALQGSMIQSMPSDVSSIEMPPSWSGA